MLVCCVSSVFDAYKKLSGSDIEDSIEGETAGNLENLLLAVGKTHDLSAPQQIDQTHTENRGSAGIGAKTTSGYMTEIHHYTAACQCLLFVLSTVKCARSVPDYFAERLYKSMRVSTSVPSNPSPS